MLDITPVEVPLPRDVTSGDTVHIQAVVEVPNLVAGGYRLDWGMLQRDVLQFNERGWADAETAVTITATPRTNLNQTQPGTNAYQPGINADRWSTTGLTAINSTQPVVLSRDDSEAPWVVGRLELWRVAVTLIARHPPLGLGPDNFRHYYGAELGLDNWDERVQANNLYLELLVDLGVLGLATFGWIVARAVRIGATAVQGVAQSTRFEAEQSTSPAPIGADQVSSRVPSAGHHSSGPVHIGADPSSSCRASAGDQSSSVLESGVEQLSSCASSGDDDERKFGDYRHCAGDCRVFDPRFLDAFLACTPTALLFWLLLGLAQAQKPQVSGR